MSSQRISLPETGPSPLFELKMNFHIQRRNDGRDRPWHQDATRQARAPKALAIIKAIATPITV